MGTLLAEMWTPAWSELRLFSPEFALAGTIVAVLLVALVVGRDSHVAATVALLGILGTLVLAGFVARDMTVLQGGYAGMSPPRATPMLLVDNFSIFFKLFLMLFLALVIGLWLIGLALRESRTGREPPPNAPEFLVLLLTSALGMVVMVGTLNLLVMVVAIETASLPSYGIVASDKRSRLGAEASLKYVMFGATTAAIMIYGVSLLYGRFGTLDVPTIAAALAAEPHTMGPVCWVAMLALGVGIAFKIAAVPFHFWCPDVFEGAPIEITTWLSVASKAAGLGLLLRIVHVLGAASLLAGVLAPLAWSIGLVAAVTCTLGNLAALRQESVKRLLAYSSIAHAGYMMMAAAIFLPPAGRPPVNVGVGAVVSYLFVYFIMNLGAFGVTALVAWRTGSDHLSRFTGLGRRAPWLALPMAVCLFSLVGLPPLGGFAAKWWLLVALAEGTDAQPWLWGLVLVLAVNTALSLYYYVRIVRQMYLTDDPAQPAIVTPIGGMVMVNACAAVLILLGTLLMSPLRERANAFASRLCTPPGVASGVEIASP